MMKNILVPTDFSPVAENAVEFALHIAQKARAEVHFLHVIVTPIDWVKLDKQKEDLYPDVQAAIGHAEGKLNELVSQAGHRGLKAKKFLYFNQRHEDIVGHVVRHHHDFMVMGSHGAKGGRELLIGFNAQKIVRHAPCSVLVVKEKPLAYEIKNIVFAASFQEDVHQPFKKVIEFADLMEANIHLLYVNLPFQFEETDPNWAKWQPKFSDYDVVIQNANNINSPEWRWPGKIEQRLEKYVKNGGGLYILHSANNAFSHWHEYNRMIGLGWRKKEEGMALAIDKHDNIIRIAKGEGENTFHGDRYDAVIRVLNRHPINAGFPDKWKTPNMELYRYARGPAENITVLSCSFDSVNQVSWPVDWIVNYGKGWVYNSSLGHLWKGETYPDSYRCIGYQTVLIRAVEWLARGKVTYLIPNNFPTRDSISLSDEDIGIH